MALTETALRLGTVPLPAFNCCHRRALAVLCCWLPAPVLLQASPGRSSQRGAVLAEQPSASAEAGESTGDGAFHPRHRHSSPGLCANFTVSLCKEPPARPAVAMAFPALPGAWPLQTLGVNKG